MTVSRPQSSLSNHSDDQRLHFHRQLMGRANSSTATNQLELHQPLLPNRQSNLGLNTTSCSFIDPLRNSTTDLSPYHHAMFNHPSSTSTRPSSRSSNYSATSPLPIPPIAIGSPTASLSSRHSSSVRGDLYNAASLFPLPSTSFRPATAGSGQFFDPDVEAERVRLAKLEQRRSLALSRPNMNTARNSSEGSIRSVHSFRSVGPSHSKVLGPPGRFGTNAGSVYRPSPLRSASTPALATMEAEAEKKKQRKEMKEEYQKMRAARIEEEKRMSQQAGEKYPSQDSPGWFASRFKRSKELPSTRRIAGHGIDDRRSTSQSSATESSAPSSSPLDDGSHSTVPTSVEEDYQELGQRPKNEDLLEDLSDHMSSYDSPPIDPFRKSMLPGQVPPTPTKRPIATGQTPKTIGRTLPSRMNIIKLNKLLESFKIGGATAPPTGLNDDDSTTTPISITQKEDKRKPKISVVESRSPIPNNHPSSTLNNNNNNPSLANEAQSGWFGSIKSIRHKAARLSRVDTRNSTIDPLNAGKRRKSIGGLFFNSSVVNNQAQLIPPVPKLPVDLVHH
ncbi:hypothetical protein PGT21_019279 [Puccinia graminis f. sp. tritici]|uniref:Uncharacterized protein n=2 Tax=Puccinia graminis f. sp. tritici TaxID=56615 RepID=A0A5B0RIP4_PUCGR|nr:hypothetical protein PGT21_019279 [Puccinia graminis f. sp. tritici]KAA1125537.1 hypothetical protein PGTUg99_016674 [Puccinia graminis f. sp. tritici]